MSFSEKDCQKLRSIFESTLERSTLSMEEVEHAKKFSVGDLIIHTGLTLAEANQFVRFIELERRRHQRLGFTVAEKLTESKSVIIECDEMCRMAGIQSPDPSMAFDSSHVAEVDMPIDLGYGDPGEQAGMIKSNLQSIASKAQSLHDKIGDMDTLPEWVQEKIAVADNMIDTVTDYLRYEYSKVDE